MTDVFTLRGPIKKDRPEPTKRSVTRKSLDGTELTIAFKDGVPNYRVDSKGDTLIIALAPAGSLDKTVAKNDAKGSKAAKHAKHDHKKAEKH